MVTHFFKSKPSFANILKRAIKLKPSTAASKICSTFARSAIYDSFKLFEAFVICASSLPILLSTTASTLNCSFLLKNLTPSNYGGGFFYCL